MDKVYVVVYKEVFGEYVMEGILIDVSGYDDCIIKFKDNRIITVDLWRVFDTMREAQECLQELFQIEQDAREDAAQAYYDDFLECADASDFARMRECVGANVGREVECPF